MAGRHSRRNNSGAVDPSFAGTVKLPLPAI